MKTVNWNRKLLDEFESLACLSDEEIEILEGRAVGKTVAEQSIALGLSERTIHYIIKKLKQKYDEVQPLSEMLPKRKIRKDTKS